jgi:shikimate dehydrogenase
MTAINGKTQLLGVIGHPVGHSLSPLMHNQAIAALDLNWVYLPFDIAPDQLETALAGFAAIGVQGFNITIPHKQAIMPLLSQIDPIAQAIGAVNTVWRTADGWHGTNTDVLGFLAPLTAMDRDWSQTTALILGNGGAARAVVAGVHQLGCQQIQVVGRSADKLAAFAQSWPHVALETYGWDQLETLIPKAGLVINTTPIGMAPHPDASPLTLEQGHRLSGNAIAYDLIYTPNPTRFLQQATDQGAIAIDGLEMLVQQGAAALERWLNQPVPVAVMRQTLQHALGLESR